MPSENEFTFRFEEGDAGPPREPDPLPPQAAAAETDLAAAKLRQEMLAATEELLRKQRASVELSASPSGSPVTAPDTTKALTQPEPAQISQTPQSQPSPITGVSPLPPTPAPAGTDSASELVDALGELTKAIREQTATEKTATRPPEETSPTPAPQEAAAGTSKPAEETYGLKPDTYTPESTPTTQPTRPEQPAPPEPETYGLVEDTYGLKPDTYTPTGPDTFGLAPDDYLPPEPPKPRDKPAPPPEPEPDDGTGVYKIAPDSASPDRPVYNVLPPPELPKEPEPPEEILPDSALIPDLEIADTDPRKMAEEMLAEEQRQQEARAHQEKVRQEYQKLTGKEHPSARRERQNARRERQNAPWAIDADTGQSAGQYDPDEMFRRMMEEEEDRKKRQDAERQAHARYYEETGKHHPNEGRKDQQQLLNEMNSRQVGSQVGSAFGMGNTGALAGQALAGSGMASLAAVAGPVGMAVAAAKEVENKVMEGVRTVGQTTADIARLDTRAVSEKFNQLAENFGMGGKLVAEFNRALTAVSDGLSATAQKLSPYSGELSAAQGQAQAHAVQGDIRRAQQLGPELAKFVEARAKLEELGQDALAKIIEPLIPFITRAMEMQISLLEKLVGNTHKDQGDPLEMLFDDLEDEDF